jgi:hypothetical protein
MQQESRFMKGWRYARFRMKWPQNTEPSWHIDLLIAHRLLLPVIKQYKNNIDLWRFHRRAARDKEGHQFSLTFYSSQKTAKKIFNDLRSDTLLKSMKQAGLIVQDIYEDHEKIIALNIEDTSDGHWSPPLRKAWPFFIMGVCQMWLSLIVEISEGIPERQKVSSVNKMLKVYHQVNTIINSLWQDEGSHAMLHHLNAIFGYEPIFVREINLRRF